MKMPPGYCCIVACHCNGRNCELYQFPRPQIRAERWYALVEPYYPAISKVPKSKWRILKICKHHFESKYYINNIRKKVAYPTLFTSSEISTGCPSKNLDELLGVDVDHSYSDKPRNNDHNYHCQQPGPLQDILTAITNKEDTDNNSENKQETDNNSADKDEVDNNLKEKEEKPKKKGNRKPQLGSAKTPIYYIHDYTENKTSNDNPNIGENSTDNDNNVLLANNPDGSSKLHKLLVDSNIINNGANTNDVTDDGEVDNDNGHVFDPNMVIDLIIDDAKNVNNSIPADANNYNSSFDALEFLVVDHTEVVGDIENNLTNEQVLEKARHEINKVKLTENLDINDMDLINYNNTVILCRKNEVAELKSKYLNNLDKLGSVDRDDQTDQDQLVTKDKGHKSYKRIRKIKSKKLVRNEEQNGGNEDQEEEVVKGTCACDANSQCEHRNPTSTELIFCDDCEKEHPVIYNFCKRNASTETLKKTIKNKKDNCRKYVTVEKFEEVNNDMQKLMQTTQQIQGQINTITTMLSSLVTAVGKIEKEREEMSIKKAQNAKKRRAPRKSKPKDPKTTKNGEAIMKTLPEQGLPVEETLPAEESLPEQETLPAQESLQLNEYSLLVHRHMPVNNDFLTVNRSLLGKRRFSVHGTLPLEENVSEDEYIPEHRHLPVNNEYIPVYGRLPNKRRLPVQEPLPVDDNLPGNRGLRGGKRLLVQETLPVADNLPGNRRSRGGNRLPVQETLPVDDNFPRYRGLRGGKGLPVQETLPVGDSLPGSRGLRGGKRLPVQETLPVGDSLPGSRGLRGGKRLPVQETLPVDDSLPGNRGLRGGKRLPIQETLPVHDNLQGNRRVRGGKRLPVLYL